MELKRIDVARQLWQMLRGILRDGGYVQSGSKMRNTANSFEDELYNPPKSEQGDSKNSSQAVQQLKDSISDLKAIRNGLKMFKRIPKNQFIRDIDAVLAKLESI